MNKVNKVVVAHPYQQHSFRMAVAIDKAGLLDKYITTVYDKKGSITNRFLGLLSGENKKRAIGRKCGELDDAKITQISELASLVLLLLRRIDKSKRISSVYNAFVLKEFNKKLAKYIIKNDVDAVILYDTVCADCIKIVKKKKPSTKIIIDMSAPCFMYMDLQYQEDCKINPDITREIKEESSSFEYNRKLKYAKFEIQNADYFIVASSVTEKSLKIFGISENQIMMCRYGIDVKNEQLLMKSSGKKKIVFIGDVTPKKGIHYFANLQEYLGVENYEYHVLGQYSDDNIWYQKMKNSCIFHGYVTHDRVLEICKNMDFVVFPSLADGFGLSVIEAMACGVVPFVSTSAGVSDIIHSGENGYVFELPNINKIVPQLTSLANDKNKFDAVRKAAYETAKRTTWESYNHNIKNAVEIFLRRE